jgi:hypothetical protein
VSLIDVVVRNKDDVMRRARQRGKECCLLKVVFKRLQEQSVLPKEIVFQKIVEYSKGRSQPFKRRVQKIVSRHHISCPYVRLVKCAVLPNVVWCRGLVGLSEASEIESLVPHGHLNVSRASEMTSSVVRNVVLPKVCRELLALSSESL